MILKKFPSLLLLMLVIPGCSIPPLAEREYLDTAYASPLAFWMPNSAADSAWLRARNFVSTYSTMKITSMTDSLISTEVCFFGFDFHHPKFGYRIAKKVGKEHTDFRISGFTTGFLQTAWRNVKIFAYYVRTGSLPYPELIER